MKTTLFIALLITLISAQGTQTFEQWKLRYNVSYSSLEENFARSVIYEANLIPIKHHNDNPNKSFEMRPNQFSDRTPQELEQTLGLKPLRLIHSQNPQKPKTAHKSLKGNALGAIPASVDWRNQGKVTAVKNQGTCGSCWAFTTTAVFESNYQIMGGSMPNGREPDFSEEYALECTTANSPGGTVSSCAGGIIEYALPFLITNGMPTEADFPYAGSTWPINTAGTPTTAGICSTSALFKQPTNTVEYNGNYENLTNAQVKDLLAYGPITAAILAEGSFMTYSSGVYTGCPPFATAVAGVNHAVVVIGYDESGNYIIKNSWGTSWGENGYATISKDADCGISYIPREIRGNNVQLNYEKVLFFAIYALIAFLLM